MPLNFLTRLQALRRLQCPFCFGRFPACSMHIRCDSRECKVDYSRMVEDTILQARLHGPRLGGQPGAVLRGPWWEDPRTDKRRGFRRHLDWLLLPKEVACPNCNRPAGLRLCPKCHSPIPDSALTLGTGHIAIFGPQSVGKTTFVTVLIHELENRVGPDRGFVLDPLTEEIGDRYLREYHDTTFGGGQFGIGQEMAGESLRRSHSATPSLETNRGVLHPLVFRLTRRIGKKDEGMRTKSALLSFFDTAGEDWEMNIDLLRGEARYLGQASGLLFLIDPLRIREVAHDPRMVLTEKELHVPAADYLSDSRKLSTFFPRMPVKVPLAICLNKLDRWGKLLPKGTRLHEWACGVPDPRESGLDSAIHEEVRSILRKWGAWGFLEYIDLNFPVHGFFACSSLGDAATATEEGPQPLPSPLLVERPILWLLKKQGVL